MGKFLSSPIGSFLKVLLAAILSTYLIMLSNGQRLFSWDRNMVEHLFTAGFVSTIPVLINWLNPKDTRYGVGADTAPPKKDL